MAWAGAIGGAALVAFAALSWIAGGPQELREMSHPVAVSELPQ